MAKTVDDILDKEETLHDDLFMHSGYLCSSGPRLDLTRDEASLSQMVVALEPRLGSKMLSRYSECEHK